MASALADSPISLVTARPGPRAQAMIAAQKTHLSPSLIHVYPLVVEAAEGCMVRDVDGNVFLDCQAGVAAAATGHCHPQVAAAMAAQAHTLIHICGTDFYYPGYGELARRLGAHAARFEASVRGTGGPWRVFLSNSGTEGVEAALKLARNHTGRTDFIAFRGGFHGRSLGSLSLTASKGKYRKHFGPFLPGVHHADYGDARSVETQILGRTADPSDIAAIVVEPVLGEGGYIVPPVEFLQGLREICDRHGIMLVFDEVQSGMGRTGTVFAAEHFGVVPDAFVLAKGLASGMPLGALVAPERVMTWPAGSHGSTCGGNPVAIAAALATLDLLESDLLENARRVSAWLLPELRTRLAGNPIIREVRGLGLMIGIDFRTPADAARVAQACYQNGLLVLECGASAIRMSPPLIITETQARTAVDVFAAAAGSA